MIGSAALPWRVESLGRGVYLFRWLKGFYLSPFLVGTRGVTAFDPISDEAAVAYRAAIASVTDKPVVRVVYSHDHRDHICGGAKLLTASLGCAVCAHASAADRIRRRGDRDILPPTDLLGDGAILADGAAVAEIRYFGPNHSDSNLLTLLTTSEGRLLVWVDGIEPGVAPYRNLPDTDFAGYLATLDAIQDLEFDRVMGGHTGPDGRHWANDYRDYILRLLEATDREYRRGGGQVPLPGEDGVAMTERVRGDITRAAADSLRERFGAWSGYEQWAAQTADRILSFLITGN